jgi:hypothetical protein
MRDCGDGAVVTDRRTNQTNDLGDASIVWYALR